MALTSGTKLCPYEIIAPLGAGGMGEVYRARDKRLDRDVAIKVLAGNLSSDPNLRQRLEREAKAVSKLSHPNICTLHDIGHQDGIDYLVMELVEGETLEQRLIKGSLPTEQTIRYSAQIADALAKAHKLGFTHPDLKPANIMLTKAGAKLMDFGLAKQLNKDPLASALTEMTVEQSKLTTDGMLVGTFQYMAPEQLEGKEADARTDIFALGELIYEMATGKPAFAGKSRASLIAAILTTEPMPITQLQPMTPLAVERVARKCLAKDPDERWQSASDLASELKWIADSGSQAGAIASSVRKRSVQGLWVGSGCVLLAALIGWGVARRGYQGIPAPVVRFALPPPETSAIMGEAMAFSPDGSKLAFVASTPGGQDQIWIRALDSNDLKPLSGTEGSVYPCWSPNGKYLGFFADGKLKVISNVGGTARVLCDAASPRGGSWNADDVILFVPHWESGVYQISAQGGEARPVTTLRHDQNSHRFPSFLPDNKHFLYFVMAATPAVEGLYLASLDGTQSEREDCQRIDRIRQALADVSLAITTRGVQHPAAQN
jgi:hypothetical protein